MRAGAIGLVLLVPSPAMAAGDLHVPPVAAGPFVFFLLAIAVLPLVAARWWHKNRNKAIVAGLLAGPTAGYLLAQGNPADALVHELAEYFSFMALLFALYVVSGGIVLRGDLVGRPRTNLLFLAAGAVLASLIGTTGASMLLIRPVLRINCQRKRTGHIPVFFIFVVSNTGGLLTPLGDPPMFLGFLRGVGFFWTASLWREWLLVNGLVLAVFYVWDSIAYRREAAADLLREQVRVHRLRIAELGVNAPLLAADLAGRPVSIAGRRPGSGERSGSGRPDPEAAMGRTDHAGRGLAIGRALAAAPRRTSSPGLRSSRWPSCSWASS